MMGEHHETPADGDVIPPLPDLTAVFSAPVRGGFHAVMQRDDTTDGSLHQLFLDADGDPRLPGSSPTGRSLRGTVCFEDVVGVGHVRGAIPEHLYYVRHTSDDHRIDIYFAAQEEAAEGEETCVLTLHRQVWPGIPAEVEALSTITGRFAPDLLAHLELEHEGQQYVLGSLRCISSGLNALEYTRMGIAAHVFSHCQGIDLGQTLRFIHDSLLMAFPYEWVPAASVMQRLENRLDTFIRSAPELTDHATWIREWYRSINGEMLMQRLHGNVQLEEMWLEDDGRWLIGGWEGELGLPLEERTRLGSPLEDLASLQRSLFRACGGSHPWCIKAMGSIFEGYGSSMMSAPFSAYMLDRACEEIAADTVRTGGASTIPLGFLKWFRDFMLPQQESLHPTEFLRPA